MKEVPLTTIVLYISWRNYIHFQKKVKLLRKAAEEQYIRKYMAGCTFKVLSPCHSCPLLVVQILKLLRGQPGNLFWLQANWLHIYQRKYAILKYAPAYTRTDVAFHNDLTWLFILLLCTFFSLKGMTCIHFLDIWFGWCLSISTNLILLPPTPIQK